MDEPVRWGIAATGGIAAEMVGALRTIPDAEVVAVGSRTPEGARRFAHQHRIGRAHGSHRALCEDPDVDVVYVASPHSAHAEMTVAALEAGKHVLCEKAFALSAAQARRMAEAARRHRRFLMEAMWTWFLPPVVEIRHLVADGAIGALTTVASNFSIPVPETTERLHRPELGGGALLDLGVYPVAFTRHLLGPPTAIRALGTIGEQGVDTNVAGVLNHPAGATAVFSAGLSALSTVTAEIVGTEGIIAVRAPFHCPTAYTVNRHDGKPERVERPHRGLAHEAEHVMARVRAGHLESDVIPLAESIAIMETLDEIRRQIGLVLPGDEPAPGPGRAGISGDGPGPPS
jgi:predicted dehydrogenase